MDRQRSLLLAGFCIFALMLSVMPMGCGQSEPPPPVDEPSEPTPDTPSEPGPDTAAEPAPDTPDEPTPDTPAEPTPDAPAESAAAATVPLGLPALPVPDDNPMTDDKIELGKLLYFDKRLSKDGTIACATCHDPTKGWAEHTPTSTGIGGEVGGANSPTVINAAYATAQFWDGRAASLEEQALGPIENPIEMGHKLEDLVPQLNEISGYKERFQKVFGTDVTSDGIAKAIAAFERTVLSGNSPYDKYKAGDEDALTEAQKAGMGLFDDLGCSSCHAPPMFSNYKYYNAGVGQSKETPDEGRKAVTGDDKDMGKFRVPSLREVANTAPYFHDGSCDTLEKAVAMMAGGGIDNANLSALLKGIGSKEVSAEDQASIVEFLKALSGEYPIVEPPELP
jgi:cytochrome c peroxidase